MCMIFVFQLHSCNRWFFNGSRTSSNAFRHICVAIHHPCKAMSAPIFKNGPNVNLFSRKWIFFKYSILNWPQILLLKDLAPALLSHTLRVLLASARVMRGCVYSKQRTLHRFMCRIYNMFIAVFSNILNIATLMKYGNFRSFLFFYWAYVWAQWPEQLKRFIFPS